MAESFSRSSFKFNSSADFRLPVEPLSFSWSLLLSLELESELESLVPEELELFPELLPVMLLELLPNDH